MKNSLSIVIPAHNEEENLPILLSNVEKYLVDSKISAEIIIVDDNSTDSTPKVSENLAEKYGNIKVVHRKTMPGMGGALKEGTNDASGEIIIWLAGDMSDDLNSIPKFMEKIKSGNDMVMGSRYMQHGSSGDLEIDKKILGKGFAVLSRIFVGTPVHDVTNAYRAFRKEVLRKVNPQSNNFAISPEFTLNAYLKGFKLDEVPTVHKVRKFGVAKMRVLRVGMSYGKVLLKAFIRRLFRLN